MSKIEPFNLKHERKGFHKSTLFIVFIFKYFILGMTGGAMDCVMDFSGEMGGAVREWVLSQNNIVVTPSKEMGILTGNFTLGLN